MTSRGKKAIPTGTEICYTRKQSKIKSAYIFALLGYDPLNPTLSAIPKTTEIQESPQSLELSGLFLFLRFRDVHKKSQTGTRKRQLWGQVTLPHILSRSSCPQCPESSRIPPFAARSPGKSLQAGGWRRPLSGSCPDEAVDPIATPLPQSFDPLPLPKQICPADTGQLPSSILETVHATVSRRSLLAIPSGKLGNKPARTRQEAAAVCMQICPSPKKGRSFSSPAI